MLQFKYNVIKYETCNLKVLFYIRNFKLSQKVLTVVFILYDVKYFILIYHMNFRSLLMNRVLQHKSFYICLSQKNILEKKKKKRFRCLMASKVFKKRWISTYAYA